MRLYVYGEQLSFLSKNKELRVTDASFDNQLTGEVEEDSVDKMEQEAADASCSILHDKRHKIFSPTLSNITPINKCKKPDVEHALVDFMENHKTTKRLFEEDEDVAFFYSLLPSIKTLNIDQKFTFRLQTMQLLNNLRKQPFTNRPMHSLSFMHPLIQVYRPIHYYPDHDLRPPSTSSAYSEFLSEETIPNDDATLEGFQYQNL